MIDTRQHPGERTCHRPAAQRPAARRRPAPRPRAPREPRGRRRARPARGSASWSSLLGRLAAAASTPRLVDPFFWGEPRRLADAQSTWFTDGTSAGLARPTRSSSPCEEAVLGFVIGVVLGVVSGIALGRIRLPRRAASPVHQGRELDPAHRPRLDLHRRLRPRHRVEGPPRRRAGVLRRLLQRLPGRPRGRPQPHRQRPASSARSRWQVTRARRAPVGVHLDPRQPARQLRLRPHRRHRRRVPRRRPGPRPADPHAQNTFDVNGVLAAMVIMAVIALVAEGPHHRAREAPAALAAARRPTEAQPST